MASIPPETEAKPSAHLPKDAHVGTHRTAHDAPPAESPIAVTATKDFGVGKATQLRRHQMRNKINLRAATAFALIAALLAVTGCWWKKQAVVVEDEAKLAGKTTADFPQISADVFKPMDGGIALSPEEIMGRNAWNLWSAGNDHFWNNVAQDGIGLLDVVNTLDTR